MNTNKLKRILSMHCWVLLSFESLSARICSLNTLFIPTPPLLPTPAEQLYVCVCVCFRDREKRGKIRNSIEFKSKTLTYVWTKTQKILILGANNQKGLREKRPNGQINSFAFAIKLNKQPEKGGSFSKPESKNGKRWAEREFKRQLVSSKRKGFKQIKNSDSTRSQILIKSCSW